MARHIAYLLYTKDRAYVHCVPPACSRALLSGGYRDTVCMYAKKYWICDSTMGIVTIFYQLI